MRTSILAITARDLTVHSRRVDAMNANQRMICNKGVRGPIFNPEPVAGGALDIVSGHIVSSGADKQFLFISKHVDPDAQGTKASVSDLQGRRHRTSKSVKPGRGEHEANIIAAHEYD